MAHWHTLVEKNIKLSYWIANKFRNTGLPYPDLVSYAQLGLVKAAKTYDADQSSFTTYALACMKNEILMAVRKERKYEELVSLSLDAKGVPQDEEDQASSFLDLQPSGDDVEEQVISLRSLAEFAERADEIGLTEREKRILAMRLANMSQAEIAQRIGYSRSYVGRLWQRILKKAERYYLENCKEEVADYIARSR